MRTGRKDFGLLYFEYKARRVRTTGWNADAAYRFTWYDPRTGEWQPNATLRSDARGEMQLPAFPGGADIAETDWAARITTERGSN